MRVYLNARPVEVPADTALLELLRLQGLDPRGLALDLNGRHVGLGRLPEVTLGPEDKIWAFPVGGGG